MMYLGINLLILLELSLSYPQNFNPGPICYVTGNLSKKLLVLENTTICMKFLKSVIPQILHTLKRSVNSNFSTDGDSSKYLIKHNRLFSVFLILLVFSVNLVLPNYHCSKVNALISTVRLIL